MDQKVSQHGNRGYLILIALAAGMAGLLYGYDTSCVSGAIVFLKSLYHLTGFQEGEITSAIMIGGVVGVAAAGFLSDHFGRRKVLIWGAIVFFVGALISAFTQTPGQLIWARIFGGIGIGLASSLSTTYISEIAPPNVRGRLSSLYQLLTTIGIFLTYLVNLFIVNLISHAWNVTTGWRWMLGIGAVPALLFFLALLFSPESPRFLIEKLHVREGYNTLARVNGSDEGKKQMNEISSAIVRDSHSSLAKLFGPGLRRAFGIGIFLAIINQAAGMNVFMYYSPTIFQTAGMSGGNANFLATVGVGAVNVIATVVFMFMIDKFGRRKLLLVGALGLTIFSAWVAISFAAGNNVLLILGIFLFVICFAFSMGPIPWVMIPELFPTYLRSRAAGLCTVLLWAANWAIGQFAPVMLDAWGGLGTFIFFAVLNLVIGVGVYFFVPETKDKSLEQIEDSFWPKGVKRETNLKEAEENKQLKNVEQVKKELKSIANK